MQMVSLASDFWWGQFNIRMAISLRFPFLQDFNFHSDSQERNPPRITRVICNDDQMKAAVKPFQVWPPTENEQYQSRLY